MPVDATHPQYDAHTAKWSRIRDTLAGSDEIKAKGQAYLPKPNGHSDDDYVGYKARAEFYPASQRTVDGLAGAIFRKDPLVEVPAGHEPILEAMTLQGDDFPSFSKSVVGETLEMGRYGVLVDIIDEGAPFAAGYTTETIINWRTIFINRKPTLQMVVLKEAVAKAKVDDPYVTDIVTQYRVLQLGVMEGDETGTLVYHSSVWEKQKEQGGKDSFVMISEAIPLRRGKPLDFIPFVFFGPTVLGPKVQKSPILDLVDTNLSHYRTSAELEEGAYFTGLPMYVVSGRPLSDGDKTVTEFSVGSRSALMLEEGGSAEVLTVSGEGMGLLQKLMESKEQRMAILGARILEDQKSGVEAAATVALRHRGENSLLASISDSASRGLQIVLGYMVWWAGKDKPEIMVELNKDFVSAPMTPKEILDLTASFQQGSIGPEVFFNALKEGERVPDGWTKEDWLKDVEEGATTLERGLNNEGLEEDDG